MSAKTSIRAAAAAAAAAAAYEQKLCREIVLRQLTVTNILWQQASE